MACAVTTIEGIAEGDRLHPLQEAFLAHGGFQCGICTPGQILAAKALLDANPRPTRVGDPALDDGQSLPLHRLLQDHRIDCGRFWGRMT